MPSNLIFVVKIFCLCFACLTESEDLREEKRHSLVVKEQRKTNDTRMTHFLRINYSTNRTKIVKDSKAKCDNVIGILQFFASTDER